MPLDPSLPGVRQPPKDWIRERTPLQLQLIDGPNRPWAAACTGMEPKFPGPETSPEAPFAAEWAAACGPGFARLG